MATLFIFLIFAFGDRALPQMTRLFASGALPFGDKEEVRRFNAVYGIIKFPRTVLLALIPVTALLYETLPDQQGWLIYGILLAMIVYFAQAGWDIYYAGRVVRRERQA